MTVVALPEYQLGDLAQCLGERGNVDEQRREQRARAARMTSGRDAAVALPPRAAPQPGQAAALEADETPGFEGRARGER